jgi:FG-GAP-like repeat
VEVESSGPSILEAIFDVTESRSPRIFPIDALGCPCEFLRGTFRLNILHAARAVAIRKRGSQAVFDRAVYMPLRASVPIYILIFAAYAAAHPLPFINQPLVTAAASPGGSGFVLTVNGTGFVSGSTVNWNGGGRATTFVSASELKANILAADIASPKTASVTVSTPSPGGGMPNAVYFDVVLAAPAVLLNDDPFESTGFAVFVGDFNGDGIMDLGTLDSSGNNVCILLANGDGSFQPETCYPTGDDTSPLSVTVGDFDGDGKLDLATANFEYPNMSVSILMGIGDGTFKPHVNYPTPGQAKQITNADLTETANWTWPFPILAEGPR